MSRKLIIDSKPCKKNKWQLVTKSGISDEKYKGYEIGIISNTELNVEGCCKVEEYTDVFIKLNLKHGAVIIMGSGLDILLYERSSITITGNISSLEFC